MSDPLERDVTKLKIFTGKLNKDTSMTRMSFLRFRYLKNHTFFHS